MKKDLYKAHVARLLLPSILMLLFSAALIPVDIYLISNKDMAAAEVAVTITCLSFIGSLLMLIEGIIRCIEYDRLRGEMARINASSIINTKINKLIPKFYATNGRRQVMAMGLETLPIGVLSPWEQVKSNLKERRNAKKFALEPVFSKAWFRAVFTPLDIYRSEDS